MGILAIIQAALEALIEFFKWQTVFTQIQARKLVYDIDQAQLAKGRDLLAKIDSARNAGDLSALSLYLTDQADAALYAARVRSAIPDDAGRLDMGVSSGVPAPAAPDSGPHDGPKPAPGPDAGPTVGPISAVPATHTIPKVPFAITGPATWWGLNPDGSNDTGDVDEHGKNMLGAFGDNNHNEQIIGCSIPIKVFHATIGSGADVYKAVELRRYKFDFLSHTTGRHLTGAWLTDLGPNERLHRPFDLTYAANKMLGHKTGTNIVTGWVTDTHTGQILEFKDWDFAEGKVV